MMNDVPVPHILASVAKARGGKECIPTGDFGTQIRVRAPRNELDFVCHLVQHGR